MTFSNTVVGTLAPVAASYARQATERALTSGLRTYSLNAGWPAEEVAALSVEYERGAFEVKVAERLQQEVFNREYGTQDSAPTGTIRQFQARLREFAGDTPYSALNEITHGVI